MPSGVEPPQIWQTSMKFTLVPGGTQQSPPSQINPQWVEAAPVRKEHRELREHELSPLLEEARSADRGAVDFAQTIIRAGFLLNGGGMVAIPAIVALFKLDAQKMFSMLLATGGAFILGLVVTWSGSICGFFALANRANAAYSEAAKIARITDAVFFPSGQAGLTAQAKQAEGDAQRFRCKFLRSRLVAIILCLVALAAFIVGVGLGTYAIIELQSKTRALPLPDYYPAG